MKYQKPQQKITASAIAKIEGVHINTINRRIKAGDYGDYWTNPYRVTLHNYLMNQEKNRKTV